MVIEVETGISIPQVRTGKKGEVKYPFRTMGIGDSFFVPTDEPVRMQSNLNNCAKNQIGRKKITIRTVDGGVRVWRTA